MNRSFYLVAFLLLIFAAGCSNNDFKKAKDGSEYKVFVNEKGKKAVAGNFIQLNILAKYKDSVLFSSIDNSMPRFITYDTAQLPPFFKQVHEGDSLIIRMPTDTLIKIGQAAPFMKKGEYLYQYFKIVKLLTTKDEVVALAKQYDSAAKIIAYKKELEKIKKDLVTNVSQMNTDDQIIKNYITKNNMKATKSEWGTYVAITSPGTGNNLGDGNVAEVNYTGKTLNDTTFDSNTDPKFGHAMPIYVNMNEFGVIPGWIDGLKLMQKGSKGKMIIPSALAYGKAGSPPKIGPNENLVFDIAVTNVFTKQQYDSIQQQKQNEMMRQQQQMQEQMQQQQQQQNNAQPQQMPNVNTQPSVRPQPKTK